MPLVPNHMERILRKLFYLIVKPDVLQDKKLYDIMQIEYNDHLLPVKKMDLGMATNRSVAKSDASEVQKLDFLKQSQSAILSLVSDLISKSPIKYSVVRSLVCLVPDRILNDSPETNVKRFRILMCFCDNKQAEERNGGSSR